MGFRANLGAVGYSHDSHATYYFYLKQYKK